MQTLGFHSSFAEKLRKEKQFTEEIEKELKEILTLEGKLQGLMLSEFFEIRKILNVEQKKYFTRRITKKLLKL